MKKYLSLSLLLSISINAFSAEKITLVADVWPPYSGDAGKSEGFMVELTKEIFSDAGIEVIYLNKPWERAVKDVIEGKIDGAVGSNNRDIPAEHVILPYEEQAIESFDFFTHKDSTWEYKGLDSLNGNSVAITAGYTFGEVLDKKLAELKSEGKLFTITGENPLFTAINLLEKKRVNIYIDNKFVVHYSLKLLKKEATTLRHAGNQKSLDPRLYVAFSKKRPNSAKYAEILAKGTKNLRKSGKLKIILDKYGVQDWKKFP